MVNTNPTVYCESINKETLIPLNQGSISDIVAHASLNNNNIDVAVSCLVKNLTCLSMWTW
jgi:hypothetical protein